ncbi:PASTA domain-containing protein [Roseitranquillus sediminis]|uniref:PASTA domain-containing protein n=1 Tax=Roseitranquillus sediminis TaxID=2809051 RepID=UPI001D0CA051|nr:PASTA domain-containing protein [Roseitranquillus sediminis]MBM9593572.1 PASTA domain-containing protein [Roseitranquillus sediminis]
MTTIKSLVNDVVASPLGDVIAAVGRGVAEAQNALDEASLAAVLDIYAENDDAKIRLLQEIGYRPTFYALPDTTGEVRVALRLGQGAAGAAGAQATRPAPALATPAVRAVPLRIGLNARLGSKLYATPVDAAYQNQFGYTADVSAKVTFKIVPIPAPQGADELRVVPDLGGRTAAEAEAALRQLGLNASFRNADGTVRQDPDPEAEVAAQEPAALTILRIGDDVVLKLET